jgi:ribose transport system substrate-binding protein
MTRAARAGRLARISLSAAAGLVLAGCGGTGSSTGAASPIRVAFFAPLANTYVAGTLKGMGEVHASGGIKVTQFDTGFDAAKEFSQVQDATTQGTFDAFIIIPLDSVGMVPAAQAAINSGVKVVNTDLELGPATDTSTPQLKGQLASVVNPPSNRAKNVLQAIVNACQDLNPCNLAFMAGAPSIDFEQLIKKGLDTLSASHPNIQVKSYQTGHGYLAAPAIPIAQNILQANPNLNVLAVSSDQATLGAEQAVNAAGRAGKVRLVSSGGSCPAIDAVKAGRWYSTIVDLPETEGRLAMQAIVDAMRNGKKGPIALNPLSNMNHDPIITKDNIGSFQCQWQG